MNNYCTKCGEQLEHGELTCHKCKTRIIKDPKQGKVSVVGKVLIWLLLICTFPFYMFYSGKIMHNSRMLFYKNKYIKPALKQLYGDEWQQYNIEYYSSDSCVVCGECDVKGKFSEVMGAIFLFPFWAMGNQKPCEMYQYYGGNCESHHYYVSHSKHRKDLFIVTMVNNDNKISIVKGMNMYGKSISCKDEDDNSSVDNSISDDVVSNEIINENTD